MPIGRLLNGILRQPDRSKIPVLAKMGLDIADSAKLPVIVRLQVLSPIFGEGWQSYRSRVYRRLDPLQHRLSTTMGLETIPLFSGNAVATAAGPEEIFALADDDAVTVELDPLLPCTLLDDIHTDIASTTFRHMHGGLTGKGVRVAVLDSGIDLSHPFLKVAESVSTCGESIDLPGAHGTHCGGVIASQDTLFPGIAPDVTLINVKVARTNGHSRGSFISQGIDEALNRHAQILSLSIGFNQLPRWSSGGQGWPCDNADCELCTAVNNAVITDGALVVVAAGNSHSQAEFLRQHGEGGSFRTELSCPGQAEHALTVGAITKRTFRPAHFSSSGPNVLGQTKPNLFAPGVNITSTTSVLRDLAGVPVSGLPRSAFFGRRSGTSMATPMVAGAAALLMERESRIGNTSTAGHICGMLIHGAASAGGSLPGGRLDLSKL